MIEVSLSTAFLVYLAMTLGVLFGIWVWSEWQSRKKVIVIPERQLIECEYCQRVYLKEAARKISQCPECRSYNE